MCEQIVVKKLFEETRIFNESVWVSLGDAKDAVQVVCRKYEADYVIHKRVKVDEAWVVDKRKAGNAIGVKDADLIRECISIFDALVEDHPASPKPEAVSLIGQAEQNQ